MFSFVTPVMCMWVCLFRHFRHYPSTGKPMTISCADICRAPAGALPSQADALTREEVQQPTKLPMVRPVEGETDIIVQARAMFKRILAGEFVEECAAFFGANNIPISPFSQMVYMVVRLVKGAVPSKSDFKRDTMKDVLEVLEADPEWLATTLDSIHTLYPDMGEPKAYTLAAVTRFAAVAEEGYAKKLFDRPFWILPSNEEVRQVSSLP